jgi:hypothetical protein
MTKVYNFHASSDVKVPYRRCSDGTIKSHEYEIDFLVTNTCCSTCITLAMCKGKHPSKLIFCPLLDLHFLDIFHRLPEYPPDGADTDAGSYGIIVRLAPLNITVWLKRETPSIGFISIIRNRVVHHVTRRFDL